MAKESRKQIIEQTRNCVARTYTREIERLKGRCETLFADKVEAVRQRDKALREVAELREKVEQLEDWNRRLMEYMDMDDLQRQQELDAQRQRAENERRRAALFNSPLFRMAERLF